MMLKVGLIGCHKSKDKCWENKDFLAIRQGQGVFRNLGPAELIGCFTCGGCPGKRITERATLLVKGGADIIAISSSLQDPNDGSVCPYYKHLCDTLANQLTSVIIVDAITGKGI